MLEKKIKSKRLTNDFKFALTNKLLEQKENEYDAFVKNTHDMAIGAYKIAYNKSVLDAVEKLTKDWYQKLNEFDVRVYLDDKNYASTTLYFKDGETRKFPNKSGWSSRFTLLSIDSKTSKKNLKLYKCLVDHTRECGRLEKEKVDLKSKVKAVISTATTTRKLIEIWPEIKEVVIEVCELKHNEVYLPVAQYGSLSKELGISKK